MPVGPQGEQYPYTPEGEAQAAMALEQGNQMPVGGAPQEQRIAIADTDENSMANKMILSAKNTLYGNGFDDFMEAMQTSDNVVEDIALTALSLITNEMTSINSMDGGGEVPYDMLLDVSAEVVGEVYDAAVQTGTYQPNSEEELTRNQNISLTMVAGELGKDMGKKNMLPAEGVAGFMEEVLSGGYDDQQMAQGMPLDQGMPPLDQGMPPMAQGMPPEVV